MCCNATNRTSNVKDVETKFEYNAPKSSFFLRKPNSREKKYYFTCAFMAGKDSRVIWSTPWMIQDN